MGIMMPKVDRVKAIRKIKESESETLVVGVTAFNQSREGWTDKSRRKR